MRTSDHKIDSSDSLRPKEATAVDAGYGWKTSICQASHRAGDRTRRIPKTLSMLTVSYGVPRAVLLSEKRVLNALLCHLVQ